MKKQILKQASPGIVLILLLAACLNFTSLTDIINPVVLWIGLITLGIPSLILSPILYCVHRFVGAKLNVFETALALFILHFPAFKILIETWLYFSPSDGPALGYMGIFYLLGAPYWLPFFIGWSWYSARKA